MQTAGVVWERIWYVQMHGVFEQQCECGIIFALCIEICSGRSGKEGKLMLYTEGLECHKKNLNFVVKESHWRFWVREVMLCTYMWGRPCSPWIHCLLSFWSHCYFCRSHCCRCDTSNRPWPWTFQNKQGRPSLPQPMKREDPWSLCSGHGGWDPCSSHASGTVGIRKEVNLKSMSNWER